MRDNPTRWNYLIFALLIQFKSNILSKIFEESQFVEGLIY